METYQQLATYLKENSVLSSAAALLSWDELTYMPPKAADGRAKQLSLLARMTHERFIAKEVGEQLGELAGGKLNEGEQANLREWKRQYDRAVKVPPVLVEEISRVAVHSRQAWGEARARSEFATFKPWLEKTVDLQRQLACCLSGKQSPSGDETYDALLENYEPYETTAHLRELFSALRPRLVELIAKVQRSGRKPPTDILHRSYPVDRQREFCMEVAKTIGFDFEAGRLDTTLHPFCTGITPGDVRLTTRYDEHDFGNCFFSVIHEMGHGLYEQGQLPEHWGTPLGETVSLGVHESQSRLWENLVARSEPFWNRFFPQAQRVFPDALNAAGFDDFLFAVNAIQPSLIRTESDEATYNLHVLLRFELEQLLLSGDLPADQLPEQWNKRMKEYLGVDVPDDRRGCLQDVHWSEGMFGYFATYTLGNLNAAALFAAARRDLGNLDSQIQSGQFSPLLTWLREKVHRHGQKYPARDLMRQATGAELSIEPLLSHLQQKAARFY